jgi:hypothetical protein
MPQAMGNKTPSSLRDIGKNPLKSILQFQAFNIQKRQTNRDKKGSSQYL